MEKKLRCHWFSYCPEGTEKASKTGLLLVFITLALITILVPPFIQILMIGKIVIFLEETDRTVKNSKIPQFTTLRISEETCYFDQHWFQFKESGTNF